MAKTAMGDSFHRFRAASGEGDALDAERFSRIRVFSCPFSRNFTVMLTPHKKIKRQIMFEKHHLTQKMHSTIQRAGTMQSKFPSLLKPESCNHF